MGTCGQCHEGIEKVRAALAVRDNADVLSYRTESCPAGNDPPNAGNTVEYPLPHSPGIRIEIIELAFILNKQGVNARLNNDRFYRCLSYSNAGI